MVDRNTGEEIGDVKLMGDDKSSWSVLEILRQSQQSQELKFCDRDTDWVLDDVANKYEDSEGDGEFKISVNKSLVC